MLKILAILVLIWIFFKAIGQIFKTVFGISDTNRSTRYNTRQRRNPEDINIDYDPNDNRNKGYKGGEYVDYEEVD